MQSHMIYRHKRGKSRRCAIYKGRETESVIEVHGLRVRGRDRHIERGGEKGTKTKKNNYMCMCVLSNAAKTVTWASLRQHGAHPHIRVCIVRSFNTTIRC